MIDKIKEELMQLFSDCSEQYGETYEQRCIYDSNFDELADSVVKLVSEYNRRTFKCACDE